MQCTVVAGPVNVFLSWKFFHPLSRLTYSIYALHATYLRVKIFSIKHPVYSDDLDNVSIVVNFQSADISLRLSLVVVVVVVAAAAAVGASV